MTPNFMSIGTTVIGLREFKEKENLSYNSGQKWYFKTIQLGFDMCCAIKSLN